MAEQITFDIGDGKTPRWATPAEFSNGKKIAVISFHRLSKEKGETTARYVDSEGKTYRLTFVDIDRDNKTRTLEVHAQGFKNDLANCVRREFGSDMIPEGQPVMLRSYKEKMMYKTGPREINRWELKKAEGQLVVPQKEIVD